MINLKFRVIRGLGIGSKIGLPTINLDHGNLEIDFGVYAGEIEFKEKKYSGLIHFGPRKSFNGEVSLEVLVPEKINIKTGDWVAVKIGRKIREIKKFQSVPDLKKQVNKDLENLEIKNV